MRTSRRYGLPFWMDLFRCSSFSGKRWTQTARTPTGAVSLLLNASPFYSAPGTWPTFEAFRIGEQPKGVVLSFGAAGVTVTPDFTSQFASNETLLLRLGVFA